MKLLTYQYKDQQPSHWQLLKFNLDKLNLLAGISGVGKTRCINTLINLCSVIQKKIKYTPGRWDISFQIGTQIYNYELYLKKEESSDKVIVEKEILSNKDYILIKRDKRIFQFMDKPLPILSKEDIGVYILRDAPEIKEIYNAFCKVYIRRLNPYNFSEPGNRLGMLSKEILMQKKKSFSLRYIQEKFNDVSTQLFMIQKYHPKIFAKIKSCFLDIFPFVQTLDVKNISEFKDLKISGLPLDAMVPILIIKENGVEEEIPIMRMSSGMIHTIIELVDIHTIPKDSIYIIDEIENSMGINVLPLMIDKLIDYSNHLQYIFTTHHPYIFNNIDIKYWKILQRKKSKVKVYSGKDLSKKFSKSHQENYIQLMNSELFEQGI